MATNKLGSFRIKKLEEKVDKHNGLLERMVAVESRSKSKTHRIDDIEGRKINERN